MSAPLFLVEILPIGPTFTLDGPEGHHAANVQRLRTGEHLILADGVGGTAHAEVTAVARGSIDVTITARAQEPPADPRLVVVQGIPKGDRGELAVQAMTETGVDEIIPWAASRSVTQWRGDRGHRAHDKWSATAREATKQSRRAWLPLISGAPDCSTKQIAARLTDAAAAFILHEEATERLTTTPLPALATGSGSAPAPGSGSALAPGSAPGSGSAPGIGPGPGPNSVPVPGSREIVLIIGPEGGISDAEVTLFRDSGALPVRLGPSVLRTSTAGVAALAVLATRLTRW
ncbi:16S rRNA (uracil(1498)-N(3))-methyltransferase [Actinoplanes sp. NPDC051851]|uniref:16S rRNA (uracil(1498)-N(3))-methyltransferase n=1 Tax=Actinoplanes sp. NPDC051851 TaxID=3154753 RepID=UPI00343A143B